MNDLGTPTEIALFAGAGGGCLASKWLLGHRIVCYVEWNKYRIKVLKQRIADGLLDDAPIWDDVQSFDGTAWRGKVDIVSGGFPCQPFSVAGKQRGADDERNMWPDTIRIIREVRPRIAWLENTPGLLQRGDGGQRSYFGRVLGDLAEAGYRFQWDVFSAGEVGAWHLRERVLIFAYLDGVRELQPERCIKDKRRWLGNGYTSAPAANIDGTELRVQPVFGEECQEAPQFADNGSIGLASNSGRTGRQECQGQPTHGVVDGDDGIDGDDWKVDESGFWSFKSPLVRTIHGIPDRVGQTKALGAAQVPLTVAYAYASLFERAFGVKPLLRSLEHKEG